MDRFEELDNPIAAAKRKEILEIDNPRPDPIWPGVDGTKEQWAARHQFDRIAHLKTRASQEQEVIDKRALLEQFAKMIEDYKLQGEAIEQFAQDNDLPGFCGWDGVQSWVHDDIIGTALQWAASNHSC